MRLTAKAPLAPALVLGLALSLAACATPRAAHRPAPASKPKPVAQAAPKPVVPPLPAPPTLGRLPQVATPTSYDIHLKVDPRQPRFHGDTTVHLVLHQVATELPIQAEHMHFTKVEAIAGGKHYPVTLRPGDWPGADPHHGDHLAVVATPLRPGKVALHFVYDAPFDPGLAGLYRARDDGRWYAYTQFEVADARKCFPGMDEPAYKTPFRVSVTIPAGMKAFGNAPALAQSTTGGLTTIQFAPTRPLPTYLVALVVGDLDVVPGPKMNVPLRGIADHGKGGHLAPALKMSAAFLKYQEQYFGIPYPYRKLDHAALSAFSAGAMENAGLITYREHDLLFQPGRTPPGRVAWIANTIAHEQSHQWFGDLVTLRWWNDVWLNESFATWMAARTVDHTLPRYRQERGLLDARAGVFGADSLSAARAIRQPVHSVTEADHSFDAISYIKGANLLLMLEDWIGEAPFRQGIHRYLHAHAWKTATSADLLAALQGASKEPVKQVADTFLDRAGVPEISVTVGCPKGQVPTATFTQTRYRPLGSHFAAGLPQGGPWHVPVCYAYPAAGHIVRRCFVLDGVSATRTLDGAKACPRWLHPNAGEYGYYRWSVPRKMLPALARAVLRPGFKAAMGGPDQVDRRSRRAFFDQVYGSVIAGAMSPAAYLRVLAIVSRHAGVDGYTQIAGSLGTLAGTWPSVAHTPAFARYVRRLLGREGRRLGWTPKPGESLGTSRLRNAVLGLLGRYGRVPWVLRGARRRARAFLAAPAKAPLDASRLALGMAAHEGWVTEPQLAAAYARSRGTYAGRMILGSMGALPPGKGLEQAMAFSLGDAVPLQNKVVVFYVALSTQAGRRVALRFLGDHAQAVRKGLGGFFAAMSGVSKALLSSTCTPAGRDLAKKVVARLDLPGATRGIDQGTERADQCIALRAFGKKPLARFLRTH